MKKSLIILPFLVLMAAGCGSTEKTTSTNDSTIQDSSKNSDTSATASEGVKTFTVVGKNFAFTPTEIKVKKGDKVKLVFDNQGGVHDLVIDELKVKTATLTTGSKEEVTFTADKVGKFEFYCSIGNHRQMGMKGFLVVE